MPPRHSACSMRGPCGTGVDAGQMGWIEVGRTGEEGKDEQG